jgi:hypothetical protein
MHQARSPLAIEVAVMVVTPNIVALACLVLLPSSASCLALKATT